MAKGVIFVYGRLFASLAGSRSLLSPFPEHVFVVQSVQESNRRALLVPFVVVLQAVIARVGSILRSRPPRVACSSPPLNRSFIHFSIHSFILSCSSAFRSRYGTISFITSSSVLNIRTSWPLREPEIVGKDQLVVVMVRGAFSQEYVRELITVERRERHRNRKSRRPCLEVEPPRARFNSL